MNRSTTRDTARANACKDSEWCRTSLAMLCPLDKFPRFDVSTFNLDGGIAGLPTSQSKLHRAFKFNFTKCTGRSAHKARFDFDFESQQRELYLTGTGLARSAQPGPRLFESPPFDMLTVTHTHIHDPFELSYSL